MESICYLEFLLLLWNNMTFKIFLVLMQCFLNLNTYALRTNVPQKVGKICKVLELQLPIGRMNVWFDACFSWWFSFASSNFPPVSNHCLLGLICSLYLIIYYVWQTVDFLSSFIFGCRQQCWLTKWIVCITVPRSWSSDLFNRRQTINHPSLYIVREILSNEAMKPSSILEKHFQKIYCYKQNKDL